MKNIGIVGIGNMGGMLAEVMMERGGIEAKDMYIFNRTTEKSYHFKESFPQLNIASSLPELLQKTDVVFLCIRPGQYKDILDDLKHHLREDHILATITSPVKLDDLEVFPVRRVVRTVPSIVNKTGKGPLLLTFGENWKEAERHSFQQWLRSFSDPVTVSDDVLRISSDIVSCGPAFISFLVERFIYSAVTETSISLNDAEQLAEKMLIAYGYLLQQGHYDLRSLREKVNVPGGITGEGLKVLDKYSEGMFEEVVQQTHQKFADDKKEMKKALGVLKH
ncbi:competence protein ComER [Alteribacillus persepolensis]|uniref:Competence protein ComER n=1 Tax=Alteribacillus persepolensis TaxID=568899 RepID=A0A1G8CMS6_9BACI|nr:late competence protein ComER [Alteribacillus persepolensis]SDH46867.1 competence protein ComER [Alteribacillus persepolensis]